MVGGRRRSIDVVHGQEELVRAREIAERVARHAEVHLRGEELRVVGREEALPRRVHGQEELVRALEVAERPPRDGEVHLRPEEVGVVGGQEARPGLVNGFQELVRARRVAERPPRQGQVRLRREEVAVVGREEARADGEDLLAQAPQLLQASELVRQELELLQEGDVGRFLARSRLSLAFHHLAQGLARALAALVGQHRAQELELLAGLGRERGRRFLGPGRRGAGSREGQGSDDRSGEPEHATSSSWTNRGLRILAFGQPLAGALAPWHHAPMARAPSDRPLPEPAKTVVLVVDDDGDIRLALEMMLTYEGFEVWTAKDGREALARVEREESAGRAPAVVLTDVKMPGLDGVGLLEALVARERPPAVILISGHADVPTAVDALKNGAADFLEKPLDQNRVLVSIQNALREKRLAQENSALRSQLSQTLAARRQEPGDGAPARAARARRGDSDASVLITGENGTGKEVVAREIHLRSARARRSVRAGQLRRDPRRADRVGALRPREGQLHRAPTTGASGTSRRPTAGRCSSTRSATCRSRPRPRCCARSRRTRSRASGARGRSRSTCARSRRPTPTWPRRSRRRPSASTCFYRLNVVPLRVPPLRERLEDVPLLARHFLAEAARKSGRSAPELEPAALELLCSLALSGQRAPAQEPARGRQHLRRRRARARGPRADPGRRAGAGARARRGVRCGRPAAENPFAARTFEEFKDQSEALFFQRKLAENEGNVKRTAETLGMQRSHLYKKLERYGLR